MIVALDDYCSSMPRIRIIVCYVPHVTDSDYIFLLAKSLIALTAITYPFCVIGDLNCPDMDWVNYHSNLKSVTPLEEVLLKNQPLYQLINLSTRDNHILDVIITNSSNIFSNITAGGKIGNSDHISIFGKLSLSNLQTRHKTVQIFKDFKNADYESISIFLKRELSVIYSILDPTY